MPVVRDLLTRLGFQVDERGFNRFDQRASQIGRTVRRVMVGIVGAAVVRAGMNIEDLTTEFTTLLRSAEKANEFIAGLREFAVTTPFQLDTLGQASKTLLAFGIEGENILGIMRMLGDTAGGNSQKLLSISRAFGKIFTRGRATMEEINILIDAGVPILGELAKALGVANGEVIDLVSSGKVTSDLVNQAFRSMTSEGGLFFRGMERASQTTSGLLSTFKDSVIDLAASFAEVLLPEIKFLTRFATALVNRFKNLDFETRKRIISIIGAILLIIPAVKLVIGVFKGISAAVGFIKLLSSPVGLVILAIAALAALAFIVIKNWDKVKAFFIRFWEGFKRIVQSVVDFFVMIWTTVRDFFVNIWNTIKDAAVNAFNSILQSRFFGFIVGLFSTIGRVAGRIWQSVKDNFVDYMERIKNSNLWQTIKALWTELRDWAIGGFQEIAEFFTSTFGAIGTFFDDLFSTVTDFFSGLGAGAGTASPEGTGLLQRRTGDVVGDLLGRIGELFGRGDGGRTRDLSVASRNAILGGSRNINIDSSITIQVPQGTPAQQQEFLDRQARAVVRQELERVYSQEIATNPRVEAQ